MVDSLHLILSEFSVSDNHKLTIVPNRVIPDGSFDPVIFQTVSGVKIEGQRAYYSCDLFQLTILKTHGVVRAILKFSVPKINSRRGINLYPIVFVEKFIECLDKLSSTMNRIGFNCDLLSAKLSQVHIFRNIDLSLKYPEYIDFLDFIPDPPKLKKRVYKATRYWNNTQEEFIAYCKSKQVTEEYLEKHQRYIEFFGDIMRIEYRMQKPGKIKQVLNIETVQDLIEIWDQLPAIFNNICQNKLFRFDIGESLSDLDSKADIEVLFRSYKEEKRYWMRDAFRILAILYVLEHHEEDWLIDVIKKIGSADNVSSVRDYLEEAKSAFDTEKSKRRERVTSLYNEIRTKMLLEGEELEKQQFIDSLRS